MYNEELLEHNLHPSNRGEMAGVKSETGVNASCGDKLTVFLEVKDGVIVDGAWSGSGCAISQASADVMIEAVRGRKVEAVREWDFTEVEALKEVLRMPARVDCARLSWKILRNMIK